MACNGYGIKWEFCRITPLCADRVLEVEPEEEADRDEKGPYFYKVRWRKLLRK